MGVLTGSHCHVEPRRGREHVPSQTTRATTRADFAEGGHHPSNS